MKKITLLVALSLMVTVLFAQKDGVAPLAKGQKQLNFGLGFTNSGLPVYVSMDFALHKDVTLTPIVNVIIGDDVLFGAAVKADYHWNYLIGIPSNWDFYAGARIGFLGGNEFDVDWGLQVGGRWYWSDKWGLNLEFGGGNGFGTTFGVSMKL